MTTGGNPRCRRQLATKVRKEIEQIGSISEELLEAVEILIIESENGNEFAALLLEKLCSLRDKNKRRKRWASYATGSIQEFLKKAVIEYFLHRLW